MKIIPVITIKKCIRNRILKCGSDPKQVRRRGKGNDDNADLMCKPPREESNISIEEQTKKEPRETIKPSLEVLVNEYSDGFKAWPWDGHYKSILRPADEEIIGSL
jgi:hypothetical protein